MKTVSYRSPPAETLRALDTTFFGTSARLEAVIADFVLERLAGEERVQIVQRGLRDIGQRLARQKRLVRGQNDVRHRHKERKRLVLPRHVGAVLVEPFAFLFVHVESRAAHLAAPERRQKRVAVDEAAARRVDERHARLDLLERFGIDEVMRFRHQRAMERNHV